MGYTSSEFITVTRTLDPAYEVVSVDTTLEDVVLTLPNSADANLHVFVIAHVKSDVVPNSLTVQPLGTVIAVGAMHIFLRVQSGPTTWEWMEMNTNA